MPVERRTAALRTRFDDVAADYAAARPGYPDALIEAIVAFAELPDGGRILEIGCGTGQATMPFAQRGYDLTCLDIGAELLAIARDRFATFPQVRFEQAAFEAWEHDGQPFDLVMSATAFHWIDPTVGYPKAARLLRPGGTLAIFANEHPPSDHGFFADMHRISSPYLPAWIDEAPPTTIEAMIEATCATIEATGLFEPVTTRTFPWVERYRTDEYLRLLNTYSNHRALDETTRAALFRELADMIDGRYGGIAEKEYLAVLFLARARG